MGRTPSHCAGLALSPSYAIGLPEVYFDLFGPTLLTRDSYLDSLRLWCTRMVIVRD